MAKYNLDGEKNSKRKSFLDYIYSTSSKHTYTSKFLDVTGSLGCWGIVQLGENGNIKR